eukprot:jgi/Undpi1/10513/HiC_scaffold_29.g12963.m1
MEYTIVASMVKGAECPYYDVQAPVSTPMAAGDFASFEEKGSMTCIDSAGRVRSSAAADADIIDDAGVGFPPCIHVEMTIGSRLWRCFVWFVRLFYGCNGYGLFSTAFLPLKYGEEGYRLYETMSYRRRLVAVTTYWVISGGGSLMFLFSEVYVIRWICIAQGAGKTIVYTGMFGLYTFIAMRPLPHRFPKKELLNSALFDLMREYFDVRVINEYRKFKGTTGEENNTCLLAQMPHAVMPYGAILGASLLPRELPELWPASGVVATALMSTPVLRHFINYLGVREAGTETILQMFADGYKAVGVVTGGIAEMFVSTEREALACIRRGFAHIAIRGGHNIIVIFAFGVSRTHTIFPGFDKAFIKNLSRKLRLPLILFRGAFGLIPHRQQLTVVIGRPIAVEQVIEGVTSEDAQAVCDEVQDAAIDIYARKKPFWEKRPIVFER